ncbi:hypothetical protein V6N12_071901 [Hibiscus sabdariffa]|uniref:Uncharacterized protein n=1 Tax=Hibiscus sabdariffa TaxID=183260 RepID=A0ABR2FLI5_9ROSI
MSSNSVVTAAAAVVPLQQAFGGSIQSVDKMPPFGGSSSHLYSQLFHLEVSHLLRNQQQKAKRHPWRNKLAMR